MIIRNETCYPKDEIERLLDFALAEVDHRHLLVRVVHTRLSRSRRAKMTEYGYGATGTAYRPGRKIDLRIGKPEDFPVQWYVRRGRPSVGDLADWREALVMIAAHEGRHVLEWQDRRNRQGEEIEQVCDAYAAWTLKRFRQKETAPEGAVSERRTT